MGFPVDTPPLNSAIPSACTCQAERVLHSVESSVDKRENTSWLRANLCSHNRKPQVNRFVIEVENMSSQGVSCGFTCG